MDPDTLLTFKALVHSTIPKVKSLPSKFVKKMDEIPSLELSPSEPCELALILAEKSLIGKFTGLWPSPKVVELWIADHWSPISHGKVSLCAAGRGYFVFNFSTKEKRDLVFRSGPYFMGSRGLFLAPWTLDFNPEAEITAAPIWVRLPHLPLHLWGKSSLMDIRNNLGRFLDSAEPKGDQFTCARVCVEVNLEKGLPEALKLIVGDWSHIQELDYEQIPFKCNLCHVYGHFAKSCPKNSEMPLAKDAKFQTVSNRRRSSRRKEPQAPQHKASEPIAEAASPSLASKNRFEALQEVEVQEAAEETAVEAPVQGKIAPETKAVEEDPPSGESLPGPVLPEIAPVPEAEGLVDTEVSPTAGSEAVRLVNRQSSSRSTGDPDSDNCTGPSPPLTRGRKSNKERREAEAHKNILVGAQTTLVPFLKGSSSKH